MSERMTAAEYRRQSPKVGGRRVTPETALKHACTDWLSYNGWLSYAIPASPYGRNGLPDRVAIKDGRTVWLEFKVGRGKLSDVQEQRHTEMRAVGAEVYVVRDVDDLAVLR